MPELPCLRKSLILPILPALLRAVPEGTDMFEVYGTPGVDIYVSPSMERSRERADTRRWCFNKGLEIIVIMNSPSNDLNDSHVSSPLALHPIFPLEWPQLRGGALNPRAQLAGCEPQFYNLQVLAVCSQTSVCQSEDWGHSSPLPRVGGDGS
jgi:hypothetical protein